MEFGTKEWAAKTLNLFTGNCKNACIYCYASANNIRYGINKQFKIKQDFLFKKIQKHDYLTMYPSTHDIRFEDLQYHLLFLTNFLKSGSPLLIVTKPDCKCVEVLCKKLMDFRSQIEWRFTIGSADNKVLKFWETNAPAFESRLFSAEVAFKQGYKTSLSIEPMLDTNPEDIILQLYPFITCEIWIGKMNFPQQRITMNTKSNDKIFDPCVYGFNIINDLIKWQADDNNIKQKCKTIESLAKKHKLNIRWKESIQKVINKN